MKKFFETKSSITDFDNESKDLLLCLSSSSDYFIPIILLTVLNSLSKKKNIYLHGYFIASGIEAICTICNVLENKSYYEEKYSLLALNKLIIQINCCLYKSFSQNLDSISSHFTREQLIKMNTLATKFITNKIVTLYTSCIEPTLMWEKNDILKYKFNNPLLKDKILTFKMYTKDELLNIVKNRLGQVCQLTITLGWLIGGGDDKSIPNLDKIANHMAIMIKVAFDFHNFENDIDNAISSTTNIVVNLGLQEAFEMFQENRQKFVEKSMLSEIHTNTIKEVIDIMEGRIDMFIDRTCTTSQDYLNDEK
jgi:hypothetical protein